MTYARQILVALLLAPALFSRELPGPGEEDDPERSEWDRFNERCASDSLKTLPVAEADFRACDADWNQVNDFATPDVQNLPTLTPGTATEESVDWRGCDR